MQTFLIVKKIICLRKESSIEIRMGHPDFIFYVRVRVLVSRCICTPIVHIAVDATGKKI
jgi:hypothetical protein